MDYVGIKRGKYSSAFQLARAMISAASAIISTSKPEAITYLHKAIHELNDVVSGIEGELS